MVKNTSVIVTCLLSWSCVIAGEKNIRFIESGEALGLSEPLKGIMSHAAACGDIDNDGDLDLYIGNFCDRPAEKYIGRQGPVSNMLLIREGDSFRQSDQQELAIKARTSGAVFVDLDNDGDLDLFVSNNSKDKGLRVPNKLFENINDSIAKMEDCPSALSSQLSAIGIGSDQHQEGTSCLGSRE